MKRSSEGTGEVFIWGLVVVSFSLWVWARLHNFNCENDLRIKGILRGHLLK